MPGTDGEKMSKSTGTLIPAETYLKYADPSFLRYFYAAKLTSRVEDLDLGVDEFVEKPISSDELIEKIEDAVDEFDSDLIDFEEGLKKLERLTSNDEILVMNTLLIIDNAKNAKADVEKIIREIENLKDEILSEKEIEKRIDDATAKMIKPFILCLFVKLETLYLVWSSHLMFTAQCVDIC